jgi:hypothetical protein
VPILGVVSADVQNLRIINVPAPFLWCKRCHLAKVRGGNSFSTAISIWFWLDGFSDMSDIVPIYLGITMTLYHTLRIGRGSK